MPQWLRYSVLISIHALRKESDLMAVKFCIAARISIHALRKESDHLPSHAPESLVISIHALRKESDCTTPRQEAIWMISIHALRKESDLIAKRLDDGIREFQSTLSVRRATDDRELLLVAHNISIHALRKESDPLTWSVQARACDFNPRSP